MNAAMAPFRTALFRKKDSMMPTRKELLTLNADGPKARRAIEVFRAAYTKAALGSDSGQFLNENPAFLPRLISLLQECSVPTPEGGRAKAIWLPLNEDLANDGEKIEVILVNFGTLMMRYPESEPHYREWGKQHGLRMLSFERSLGVHSAYPKLHQLLGDGDPIVMVIDIPQRDDPEPRPYGWYFSESGVWRDTASCEIHPRAWYAYERE